VLALRFGPGRASAYALANERALKLSQRSHDVENQLALGRGSVDVYYFTTPAHLVPLHRRTLRHPATRWLSV
jgi:hypothetical protein